MPTLRTRVGLVLALASCFNPTGYTSDAGTGTAATSGTASSSEPTGTAGACGPCSGSTPYCLPSGECGGCQDLPGDGTGCATLNLDLPTCDPGSGKCVECITPTDCGGATCDPDLKQCVECVADTDCTASGKTPICDPNSRTCRGCREHSECPDTACELDVGTCFPPAETDHVYVTKTGCMGGTCSKAAPCCTVAAALTQTLGASAGYHVVHVGPGTYDTLASFKVITSLETIAILGKDTTISSDQPGLPVIVLGDVNDANTTHDTKLFLAGLTVTGGMGTAAFACWRIQGGLWIDDPRVQSFTAGVSVSSTACRTAVRRGVFVGNFGGALADQGGVVRLEDTIIAGTKSSAAIQLLMDGGIELVYSTIGDDSNVPARLLACGPQASVTIHNSALFAVPEIGSINCPVNPLNIDHSAVSDMDLKKDMSVVLVDDPAPLFVNWAGHDLHLAGDGGPLASLAVWKTGDPWTDVGKVPRTAVDGAPDVAGADLPGPP